MSSTKNNTFHLKQFSVDQENCAMKVNTDAVLLGALVKANDPQLIFDIGTGTGVIALMLAQRYPSAFIEAVEIDEGAAKTAAINFSKSTFSQRMTCFQLSFQEFSSKNPEKQYDLIVCNPPFFTGSLKNPDLKKQLARHTQTRLFNELLAFSAKHLNVNGLACFILPLDAAVYMEAESSSYNLKEQQRIDIQSFPEKTPHRRVICFGRFTLDYLPHNLAIYSSPTVYTSEYRSLLKDFLMIF